MSNEPKPRDSGAFNNVLPEHLEDQLRIAKASGMPSACTSPQGCHDHGCHGACLEDEDAMTDTKTLLSEEQIDDAIDAVLRASGSAMRHYTTQKTIDSMRTAMRQVLDTHTAALVSASALAAARAELSAAQKRIKELEPQAANYQKLRSANWFDGAETLVVVRARSLVLGTRTYTGDELDAALAQSVGQVG